MYGTDNIKFVIFWVITRRRVVISLKSKLDNIRLNYLVYEIKDLAIFGNILHCSLFTEGFSAIM